MQILSPEATSHTFWKSVIRNFLLTIVAYYLGLKFIYPGYFHPLAAHHSDMYIAAELAASNFSLSDALGYPRPALMLALSVAGDLGFEGSLILFTLIGLVNLSVALTVLEVFFIKNNTPVFLSIFTLLTAVCAPGFYISYTHDNGAVLATLFGLAGICTLEFAAPSPRFRNCILFGLLCLLSALCKESFLPALQIYAVLYVLRFKTPTAVSLTLLSLPILAFSAALIDAKFTQPTFINTTSSPDNPYHISISPTSIAHVGAYYFEAIARPAFIATMGLALLGAFFSRRLLLAFSVTSLGLSLYAPYLILPNHLMPYYWWCPMPFLMLLVPIAAISPKGDIPEGKSPWRNSWMKAHWAYCIILCVCCGFSVWQFRSFNQERSSWFLVQQNVNRNLLAALRSIKRDLVGSKSVLVLGINYPFHPWVHPLFLEKDLGYSGTWQLIKLPSNTAAVLSPLVRTTDLEIAHVRDFDLVLIFNGEGNLIVKYSRSDLANLGPLIGIPADEFANLLSRPELLMKVLGDTPTNDPSHAYYLGKELFDQGCNSLAAKYLTIAIEDTTDHNPYAYFFMGKIFKAKHDFQAALRYYEQAVKYDNSSTKNPFFIDELLSVEASSKTQR